MKVIIITNPTPILGEKVIMTQVIEEGLADRIHLRRPLWSAEETETFLRQLPTQLLPHIVLHDYHQLLDSYPVAGVHFNRRHPYHLIPHTHLSASCHTLAEVAEMKPKLDYLFLSPIFDSISKPNYRSAFSLQDLKAASTLIDHKVIALGGLSLQTIPLLKDIPFGGVALLGNFWQQKDNVNYLRHLRSAKKDDEEGKKIEG